MSTVAARADTFQQMINAVVASELFRREQKRAPTSGSELVPKYLRREPMDLREAIPIKLTVSEDGIIFSSSIKTVMLND